MDQSIVEAAPHVLNVTSTGLLGGHAEAVAVGGEVLLVGWTHHVSGLIVKIVTMHVVRGYIKEKGYERKSWQADSWFPGNTMYINNQKH